MRTHTADAALRTSQAAKLLNAHPETIRRLVAAGEIYAFRVGHSLRIPASEIERIRNTPAVA